MPTAHDVKRPRPAPGGRRPSGGRVADRSGAAGGSPNSAAARRSRRRFARRQWARRWLTWRYLLGTTVVLALVIGGIWAVYFSSALRVRGVEVDGISSLTQRQVLTAAAVPTGGPLATADLSAIRDRVEALATVRSADVTRDWPHQVRIVVVERTPVAVVAVGSGFRGIDEDGVVFGTYAKAPAGLPVITPTGSDDASRTTEALREAARVAGALPAPIARVTDHISLSSADDVELDLTGGRTVRWGSSVDSATKAQVLAALLRRPAKVYDVSVPGSPVTSG